MLMSPLKELPRMEVTRRYVSTSSSSSMYSSTVLLIPTSSSSESSDTISALFSIFSRYRILLSF